MKKDAIFQFVCFITNLDLDDFAPKWEYYAKKLTNNKKEPVLQQQLSETKNRFRYVSRHEWPNQDIQFSFMDERKSEHFPETNVKVVQTGGYLLLNAEKRSAVEDDDIKLLAFISHNENDIEFYREVSLYHQLNIYQAFYESCSHGYIMEFFIPEKNAEDILLHLKQRPGVEAGLYKECLVPHT